MRALTFPPLTEDNNSPMKWLSVKFDSGLVSVEITDEGGGAFAVIETSDQWRIEAEELLAFANWVAEAVAAVDENCGNARPNSQNVTSEVLAQYDIHQCPKCKTPTSEDWFVAFIGEKKQPATFHVEFCQSVQCDWMNFLDMKTDDEDDE